MPSKKTIKPNNGALASPREIEVQDIRSGYGDNHAATEDVMMAAHAKHMQENDLIDDQMAGELSKPRRHFNEVTVKYTSEYLAMNPSYTGQDYDEMPTLEMALRRQKERDHAMLKLLKDFRAGKVDEAGNRITNRCESSSISPRGSKRESDASNGEPGNIMKKQRGISSNVSKDKCSGGTTMTVDDSSNSSSSQSPTQKRSKGKQHTDPFEPSSVENRSILNKSYVFIVNSAGVPPTTATTTSISSSYSSSSSLPKKKRIVTPIPPLPGHPTYADIGYYQLTALCRQRNIPSSGNEQEVRNTLILDDSNVAQGLKREVSKSQGSKRKYKHHPPMELKTAAVGVGESAMEEMLSVDKNMDCL